MHLRNVQALRGAACLAVVLFHVAERELRADPTRAWLLPIGCFGYAGVDLFFVLSGFIITWVNRSHLGEPGRMAGYLGRRLWRVYPVYWACWLLALPVTWLAPTPYWSGIHTVETVVRATLLVPPVTIYNVLPPAWTLFFEVTFYVAFAVFFVLPRRAFVPTLGAWAVLLILGPRLFARAHPSEFIASARCLLHPFVAQFLLGCGIAEIVRRGWVVGGRTCLVAGVVGFYVVGKVMTHNPAFASELGHRVLLFGGMACLTVYGAAASELQARVLAPRWLQTVGDASYPIYLIHYPLMDLTGQRLLAPPTHWPGHLLWIAAMTAVGILAGFAIHFRIERPLLNVVRRRPPLAPPAPAPSRRAA
jgi:peptidoglycan/LPS O-acetylase OafA/YrhL